MKEGARMTGLIGMAKTVAIAALAAFGLLLAGGQLSGGETADVSSGNSATTTADTESGQASISTTTDSSAQSETASNSDCLDNCLAPCAAACADPQRPPLDGAVEDDAAFGPAVAPEHPNADITVGFGAETNTGAAGDSSPTSLGASSSTFGAFGVE
jgi:hypothetical protein